MKPYNLIRQADLIPMDRLGEQITIVGAGAIGSFVTLALAKIGFGNLTVFDADSIEHENLSSQFYPMDSVGHPKVVALAAMIEAFSGFNITARQELYEGGAFPGIVISAVDNMATRRLVWEQHKGSVTTKVIIDPRMAIETGLIYCMNPNDPKDVESYEKTLYSDEEAVREPCTMKAVMYSPLIIAGMVAKTVKDLAVGKKDYTRVAQLAIASNQYELWPRVV